jgi:hypothetical protein
MFEASIVVSFHIVVTNMFGVYLLCVGFIRLTIQIIVSHM